MARTPTTHDPFNAVAEPKRRQVLEALGRQELSVNEIVKKLGWTQPMVSKHLGVLKQVGALTLGAEAGARYEEQQKKLTSAVLALAAAEQHRAGNLIAEEAIQQRLNDIRKEEIDFFTKKAELEQRAGDFQVRRLQTLGAPENAIIQKQIDLLRTQEEALRQPGAVRSSGDLEKILQEIELLEIRQRKLGEVTINVGQHVGQTLNDIFTAMINGTLKSVDVGRAAVGTIGRIITDIFTQTIKNKLSFEFTLLTNMRGLPGQMNGALASGAAGLPGSGGGTIGQSIPLSAGGFGGNGGMGSFITNLFGGGSGGGPSLLTKLFGGGGFGSMGILGTGFGGLPGNGMIGPLMENGNFFSSSLGTFFGGGGGASSSLGGGLLGAGIGALFTGLGGGFSGDRAGQNIGSTVGGTIGGVVGSIFPGIGTVIGSVGGSMIGGLFGGLFGGQSTAPIA